MKSLPTVFVRDGVGRVIFPAKVEPECEWVANGEGVATIKWDGSPCAVIDGKLYKRHRHQAEKGAPPEGWVHHSRDPEQKSGHGWLPVRNDPSDRWHLEAFPAYVLADGTYELVGPKVQSNPYGLKEHELRLHGGDCFIPAPPRDAEGLMAFLARCGHEGIVFHHPDGRMAKLKCRDFGLSWKLRRG